MKKNNLILLLFAVFCSYIVSAQKMVLGSSIADVAFNYCLYSGTATNMCALTSASGSMQGFEYALSYDVVVLDHTTLNADAAINLLTGGTGIDVGAGAEYHPHYTHKIDPFDLYLGGHAGYSHLNYNGGLLTTPGNFLAAGLYYSVGVGARKYLIHNVGIFINVNYGGHTYTGGEVTEGEGVKIPYRVSFSGLNVGGGICVKIRSARHPLID